MRRRIAFIVAGGLLVGCLVFPGSVNGADGVFDSHSLLEIEIRAPWRSILRQRDNPSAVTSTLEFKGDVGSPVVIDAQIKVRGKWRLEHCDYPPFTMTLDPRQIESTPFEGQTVVHGTVPCHRSGKYQQHLIQEHLVYRIYQILTDTSLRTRPVRLRYWDTGKDRSLGTVTAFLVEDVDLAASRFGRRRITAERVSRAVLDPGAAALHSLFQFMIGHTDWSMISGPPGEECCHNAVLLAPAESESNTQLVPVPFDFDASGLVDTGDTRPSAHLRIQGVRQRLYRGFCIHNAELVDAIDAVNHNRQAIEALLERADSLPASIQRRSIKYLDGFYDIINSPEKLEETIVGKCRQ